MAELKPKAQRVRRASVNGIRNILTIDNKDANYEYRFVNDIGARVAGFKERGYEVVTEDNLKVGDSRVATPSAPGSVKEVSVGAGVKSILMRIPKEYYKEDAEAKEAEIKSLENSMKTSSAADYGSVKMERDK